MTFGNTGPRRIFVGWMSNREYANQVPTSPWRSAMTVPRELALQQVGSEIYLTSQPSPEVAKLAKPATTLSAAVGKALALPAKTGDRFELKCKAKPTENFALTLANAKGEELIIGYDKSANQYFIDRKKAGNVSFSPKFAGRHVAPRLATSAEADLTLLFDASSVELFADHGLTVMSELFFLAQPLGTLQVSGAVQGLTYAPMGAKRVSNCLYSKGGRDTRYCVSSLNDGSRTTSHRLNNISNDETQYLVSLLQ